ncbi:hypothetical protein FCV25MIE_01659 [Fagus crenata]
MEFMERLAVSVSFCAFLSSILLFGFVSKVFVNAEEILNWWELFTVSIIDVNVVVVGAEQDEGEAEPKFALYFVTCTFL